MTNVDDLIDAIKANDTARAAALVNADPALVNAHDEAGVSMLARAAYYGRSEIARLLLNQGAQMNIHEAAMLGETERLTGWLVMQPKLVNTLSPDGYTPLHLAAYFGHLDAANVLLAHGADPNIAANNPMHVMPLHSAVAGKYYEIAARLIEAGAEVNAREQYGLTPLHAAAQNGDLPTVQLLLQHGADLNARVDKNAPQFADMTALDIARQAGAANVIALLQAHGGR